MKKLYITFILLIFACAAFAQINPIIPKPTKFPCYYIERGDTIGVVVTIKQAQKIDKNLELLKILEEKSLVCDSTQKLYLKVVDEYGRQIVLFEEQASSFKSILNDKDLQINNLNQQIINLETDRNLAVAQRDMREEQYKNMKKINRGLFWGTTSLGVVAVVTTVLSVVFSVK